MTACAQCGHGPTVRGLCPNPDCQFSEDAVRRVFIRATAAGMLTRHPTGFQPSDFWSKARALWDAKPEDC